MRKKLVYFAVSVVCAIAAIASIHSAGEQRALADIADRYGIRAAALAAIALAPMARLKLHAQVVDQFGRPVSDARVRAGFLGNGFMAGRSAGDVRTDEEGRLRLSGRGTEITIGGIEHPKLTQVVRLHRSGDGLRHSTGYWFDLRSLDKPGAAGRSSANPFVIPVWRVEEFEPVEVVTNRSSIFGVAPGKTSPEKFGLRASCTRSGADDADEQSWTMSLEVAGDGGFRRADDLYLNEAPSAGYDRVRLEYSGSDRRVVDFDGMERYYYRAMDGRVHGVISFRNVNPFGSRRLCAIDLRYVKYNATGSRSLATPPRTSTSDG